MADIVLLFVLKGRDCMSKVLIEVLVIILIAGSYLILFSAVRVSAIADQRIAEIRSRETFDKEKQLNTNQNSISGGITMANKEKKIEGRLGYNSENGRYGLLVSDLWEHTGFHCGECLECQTAHCGRRKPHFDFGGNTSPIVSYRHLPQTLRGLTADCRSLV